MEQWKDAKGYEGLYEVSSKGRVKGLVRGKILTNITDSLGYQRVVLYKENKRKVFKIHRLVASHFIDNAGYELVNHIDGDKSNNNVENLEWCNHLQNTNHAIKSNLKPRDYGKLVVCNETGLVYKGSVSVAKRLGISHTMISAILKGYGGTAKGFTFKYSDSLNGQPHAIGETLLLIDGELKSRKEWLKTISSSTINRKKQDTIIYEVS